MRVSADSVRIKPLLKAGFGALRHHLGIFIAAKTAKCSFPQSIASARATRLTVASCTA